MTHRALFIVVAAVAFAFTATPAEAAKGRKARKANQPNSARFLGRFDTDHNGSLDTSEAERVRQAYDAMKKLDTNSDAQLSDSEISAAKVAQPKRGKRGKNKKDA